MSTKPKIIIILGATATGKSAFAVDLAKRVNGEIVSADSRQVYAGLDIGSGKITKKEMQGVPHHLLDVANLKKVFDVATYKKLAEKSIDEILARGKVPIVVGGTGFYIDAIVNGTVHPQVPPNKKLRETLEKQSLEKLFSLLKKLDPKKAKVIDRKNKVRLVRAIEIAKALGKVPAKKLTPKYDCIQIGLTMPDVELKKRIALRTIDRLQAGMITEVKKLHKKGLSWKRLEAIGFDQKYIAQYLQKKIEFNEMLDRLLISNWQYAKRQWTWFKRDKRIIWIRAGDGRIELPPKVLETFVLPLN